MGDGSGSRFGAWLDDLLTRSPRFARFASGLGLAIENAIKIPLYRCQRCGECVLSHTAFICSQRCPKRLRNGACGGTRPGGYCEVYPERRCIWYLIHARSRTLGRFAMLTEILRPHQWSLEKTSAWLNVFRGKEEPPVLWVGRIVDRLDPGAARRALEEREP
jgi:methylenetetrahydrofolate reductase (NADPH)